MREADSQQIVGSCHCGKVRWTYKAALESATACNCTTCRRYGALWAYGYDGKEIEVVGSTQAYQRGDCSLGFHFCTSCGCIAYWLGTQIDENGDRRIAVNLRLTEDPEKISHLLIDHFDGFDRFEDLPRDGRRVKDMWF